ncbi:hypothetical protein MHU86_25305 [Fragilaria crotonensis]|nr:hypothetical protein MHU86_25305 [Fragilaria crotonensis]
MIRTSLASLTLLFHSLDAFVVLPSSSNREVWQGNSLIRLLNDNDNDGGNNNDNDGPIEFSDFGDNFWAGDESLSSSSSSLSSPTLGLQKAAEGFQQEKELKLTQNWQQGNWKVRGFSLDRYNAKEDADGVDGSTTISKIALGLDVLVGRTDGSVCLVELGTEYWTKFESKLKIVETSNLTVAVESQLVRSDEEEPNINEIPFEVVHQFMAHEGKEISALLLAENVDDETIVVTADVAGHLTVWSVPDVSGERVFPLRNLEAHSDRIVALKQVSIASNVLLFSASIDGSLALWDMWTGDLVYRCQMEEPTGAAIRILSVDAKGDRVFLGLSSGHVVAYLVSEMVQAASMEDVCLVPNGRFLAHQDEGGVTAIACSDDANSLITGGMDGVVKQWDILTRIREDKTMFEHWPRLSNQRMKQRAHLFQGHENKITALQYHPNAILSAGVDGTVRAWNYKTGKELFVMDGFSANINSLCLSEDTLVTNGMNQFVCVHDFNIDVENEVEDGIDLDW